MTKRLLTLSLVFAISSSLGQSVIVLQPNGADGKDAYVHSLPGLTSVNFGDSPELVATAWTYNGIPGLLRSVFEFDLPEMESNMELISAELSLFSNNTTVGQGLHSTLSGSNACFLSRVIEPWSENTVTWDNQPEFSVVNQISLPVSISANQDYEGLDVTALVSDMLANPNDNNGFMLRLQDETFYRRMNFASSDHTNPNRRPKLVLTFGESTPIDSCLILQPNAQDGKDSYIHSLPTLVNANFGSNDQFVATAWTFNGVFGIVRSLLQFDLSSIPDNAIIQSAELTLKAYDSTVGMGLHSTLSGSNESTLRRIVTNWEEDMVTWNNQPNTTFENEVYLSATTSTTQNFDNINVTSLVQDMIENPTESYGFLFSLQTEEFYRRVNFASSNHANSSLRPKIEVCYSIPSSTLNPLSKSFSLNLFPNPTNSYLTIAFPELENESMFLNVVDLQGRLVLTKYQVNSNDAIDITSLENGIYNLVLYNAEYIATKKFVVQK